MWRAAPRIQEPFCDWSSCWLSELEMAGFPFLFFRRRTVRGKEVKIFLTGEARFIIASTALSKSSMEVRRGGRVDRFLPRRFSSSSRLLLKLRETYGRQGFKNVKLKRCQKMG